MKTYEQAATSENILNDPQNTALSNEFMSGLERVNVLDLW